MYFEKRKSPLLNTHAPHPVNCFDFFQSAQPAFGMNCLRIKKQKTLFFSYFQKSQEILGNEVKL